MKGSTRIIPNRTPAIETGPPVEGAQFYHCAQRKATSTRTRELTRALDAPRTGLQDGPAVARACGAVKSDLAGFALGVLGIYISAWINGCRRIA
jgi:hypothetical protein